VGKRKVDRRITNTGSHARRTLTDDRRKPVTQVTAANVMGKPQAWKAWFSTNHGNSWATNSLVFSTREDAKGHADELAGRWLAVTDWEPRVSDDIPTHVWDGIRAIEVSSRSQLARISGQVKGKA
jgi:hypothetical protein